MSGIQFFNMSYADINREEAVTSITNNDVFVEDLINRDPKFVWESTGSNDTDTITLETQFEKSETIDTLILVKNNLKAFQFQYLTGASTWVQLFAETSNTQETYYKKFNSVTTTAVRLLMDTTMVVDSEKTIQDFIVTKEIGQFVGYPELTPNFKITGAKKKMIDKRDKILASGRDVSFRLALRDHVGSNDRALFNTLASLEDAFLIWPCGGNESQFAHADIGWRLEDIFLVAQDPAGYSPRFTKNLYFSGLSTELTLVEVA